MEFMLNKIRRYCFNLLHPAIGEVWQLHRVTNEVAINVAGRDYEITPQRLISLIEGYQSKGYHFISIDQLFAMHQSNQWDNNFVCVTLDDGYADNYEIAYPIFKQYNIPFCIFVTKNFILNGYSTYRLMSVHQIIEIGNDPLCTIGCHTVSHPRLNLLSKEEQKMEIVLCKDWLEELIHQPVCYFAYPYGALNEDTLNVVAQCGIKMAFMAWGSEIRRNQELEAFQIPRKLIKDSIKKSHYE